VFPNSQHTPSFPPQSAIYKPSAFLVAGKFHFPEGAIAFRLSSMNGATMPEATIHKHSQFNFFENEVWFAEDSLISPPACDSLTPEKFCEHKFCVLVAARAYARHNL
jgi:hypothetical protein